MARRLAGRIVLGALLLGAAQEPPEGAAGFAALEIDSVGLETLSSDAATLSVQLAATATRSATIRSLAFDDVTVNGVPVYVPPVDTALTLRAGERIQGIPPLSIRISFRQLDTLRPIREIVAEERARIHMVVRAELQLSLFQKLAIMAPGLWVVSAVDRDLEVSTGGGAFARTAALAALFAAEPVWIVGREAIEYRRHSSDFARQAREQVDPALVKVETTYQLSAGKKGSTSGESASAKHSALGFLTAGGEIFTTAEAVEPWAFDAPLAEAIESGKLKVDRQKLEIVATLAAAASMPEAPPRTYSLQAGQLQIRKVLAGGTDKAVSSAQGQIRYKLRARARNTNAAVLFVPALASTAGAAAGLAPSGGDFGESPRPAAVFVMPPSGVSRIVVTEARRDGERLVIADPVDALAFGSPLWIEGGFAGMMQDSQSAVTAAVLMQQKNAR